MPRRQGILHYGTNLATITVIKRLCCTKTLVDVSKTASQVLTLDDASAKNRPNGFPFLGFKHFYIPPCSLTPTTKTTTKQKMSSPFRTLWQKWKALPLPWRRRWLAGPSIPLLSLPAHQTNTPPPPQAPTSPATNTTTSAPPAPPPNPAASCNKTHRSLTPTSASPSNGTNGSGTPGPRRPRSQNCEKMKKGRRG